MADEFRNGGFVGDAGQVAQRVYGAGSFPPPPPGAYEAAGISPGMMEPKVRSRAWMWWVSAAVVLVLVAAGVGMVRAWRLFQGAGKEQISQIHHAMKAGDADAIYRGADEGYKGATTVERNRELFAVIREKMGDPVSYTVSNVSTNASADAGQTIRLVLNTKFEKGDAEEIITFHKVGDARYLYGYRCLSPLLKDVKLK